MRKITLQRVDQLPDPEVTDTYAQTYGMTLTVTAAYDMPAEVFVKQRLSADGSNDVFVAVASTSQLEDLSVDAPTTGTSFFRSPEVTIRAINPATLDYVFNMVEQEITLLIKNLNALDISAVPGVTYNIASECPTVAVIYGGSSGGSGSGSQGPQGPQGPAGTNGLNGWTPVIALILDGQRIVQQVVNWTGGTGTKPAVNLYVGSTGFVALIADAVDIRGAAGANGSNGTNGTNGTNGAPGADGDDGAPGEDGWAPVFAIITDGARRVLQVTDWVSGTGAKPATGDYVGATGLTPVLANAVDIRGPSGTTGSTGSTGAEGDDGWVPILAVVADGARRVHRVVDWTGGTGTKPSTGQYLGPLGLVTLPADATDLRGATGADGAAGSTGATGNNGLNGWSAVVAAITDGSRRVHQVVDWVGGTGSKPATGDYIGATGFVALIANAVDIRGPTGANGANGTDGANGAAGNKGWSPAVAIVSDGARRVLQVTDWVGGEGTKPATGSYVGATGLVALIADAVDIRGPTGAQGIQGDAGATGSTGAAGNNGWAPILAVVTDGSRRVLQVTDWTGGGGSKPATGDYIGVSGLVSLIANAVDIRGSAGADGAAGGGGLITATWDGSGMVIATGIAALRPCVAAGTLNAATLVSTLSGTCEVTVNRYTPAGGALGSPTLLGTITLTGAAYVHDATLSGWTKTFAAGDVLELVTSGTPATVQRVTLNLYY